MFDQTNKGTEDDSNEAYSEEELREKIKEYIHFIDHTLQPELAKAVANREEIENEINEYSELNLQLDTFIEQRENNKKKEALSRSDANSKEESDENDTPSCNDATTSSSSMKAMVDLGSCRIVYCQARISNLSLITVDIGKGVHVQLTLEEAKTFCANRIEFLETNVLPKRVTKAQTVAGHLEDALSLLESLGKELRSMDQ